MSDTRIIHKGKEKSWEGPIDAWEKHRAVIEAWCDGSDVEWRGADLSWAYIALPSFNHGVQFRVKVKEPMEGEVWETPSGKPCVYVCEEEEFPFVVLDGTEMIGSGNQLKYVAPSVKTYYAQKFLEESLKKDCGFDYEDSVHLLKYLKGLIDE